MTAGADQIRSLPAARSEARRRYRQLTLRILPATTLVLLLVLWQAATTVLAVHDYVLPSPLKIINALGAASGEVRHDTLATLYEVLIGYALAIVVAVPLAVAVVESQILRRSIYPVMIFLQSIPKVALAPLFLIWVGYGSTPKILIVLLTCFFPIFLDTASGLASTESEQLDLMRSFEATRLQILRKVRFPTAMPQLFVGLKVGITLAVIGAVVGEFVSATKGLGYLIETASSQLQTPLAFGGLLVLAVMSIVLFYLVELIERLVVPWSTHASDDPGS